MRAGSYAFVRGVLATLALVAVQCAWADDRQEYVAELDVYHKLSANTRLFLTASLTDAETADTIKPQGGVYLDITLKGELRERLHMADWARSRNVWVRIGYTQLRTWDGHLEDVSERRGVLQMTVRAGSWQGFQLTHRAGVDFRDLNGKDSQRYRYRLDVEHEMKAANTVLIPYVRAEVFYDTRYSKWSKQSYQAGSEIDLTKHWRIEPYFAFDRDTEPGKVDTGRWGLLAKFYW